MNKTAIKNFATWARKKLIADITYKASLMGITNQGIKSALPQSMPGEEAYDIGTKEPYVISGDAVRQRAHLARLINDRAKGSDYQAAFNSVVEEVAYTWFNRLIAIRFMEVNDYMPDHIRVLSSENGSKLEPDMVTTPFDTELEFTEKEKQQIIQLKNDNAVDELFQILFIKECNSLNQYLPRLFEKTSDYTELLLNVSVTDKDGVVYHLVHDIEEQDFDINNIGEDGRPTGQVEIIGWLYQYYNAELKDETFALLKKNKKITKERIPSATQLFTPDWIVRYMVENSLGRVWLNGHPNDELKKNWIYYIDEAKQEPEVEAKLAEEREEYKKLKPEDLTLMDPSMGSGHILVYGFDVLMQIYTSVGYSERDAAQSILKNNLYGLDIDERAFQLAYFAVMMKGRQYDRRILTRGIEPHVYAIEESNDINREHLKFLGNLQDEETRKKNQKDLVRLLDQFHDAKIYGSIIKVENYDFDSLREYVHETETDRQLSLETFGLLDTVEELNKIIDVSELLEKKYLVTITNPPYMGRKGMNSKISEFLDLNYQNGKMDLFAAFILRLRIFTQANGLLSMMSPFVWLTMGSYEKFREEVASLNSIVCYCQPHPSSFSDAAVSICTLVLRKGLLSYNGSFIKISDVKDPQRQAEVVKLVASGDDKKHLFVSNMKTFKLLPGYRYLFWPSKHMLSILANSENLGSVCATKQGMATTNNDLFLRLWYEVEIDRINFNCKSEEETVSDKYKWYPFNKGGGFQKWYGNNDYVVNFQDKGKAVCEYIDNSTSSRVKSNGRVINRQYYFKKCITWSDICGQTFAARACSEGFIFSIKGASGFTVDSNYFYVLALLNSYIGVELLNMINPSVTTNVGDVSLIPFTMSGEYKSRIDSLASENVHLCVLNWDSVETSWNFKRHPLIAYNLSGLISDSFSDWKEVSNQRFTALKKNEEELNSIFINIYGLQDELSPNESDAEVTVRKADFSRDIRSLISYAVGCMFGRYSLDVDGLAYAGGDWDASKYSTFMPDADNVIPITDEEYLDDDIVGLLIQWLKKVYGEDTLEENLDFIAKALGNKGNTSREIIRNYFLTDFFKDHCQTYSVTGSGKRPIYWLYDSGKQNGFKALIYMHRYNEDTTGVVRVKYLHRMEQIYTNEIDRMQDMMDHSKSAHDVSVASKRKEKLQKQLKECRDYDEKIAHLALDRIAIDLDDGVKVNYRKVQTGSDGKFYEVLADSKNIMSKQ
ncbi:BREX-1 system adenine-specific DNA-methyltransferase PglX [Galactobacillus timonensis]|uniref:BREX-1 system adenine-specific DNA-methyltransferase PglX n=1 Tax=Galactobacillus timonensis TaxID=2041840 RepID=UPI000C82096B|nr:BREX-1 system adenine-specific DNA-methyltransferase PglX [Galactobacillus timonensis]